MIDSGAVDGILFYVLPYVRGDSLRAKLVRDKQLGIDETLLVARQVASALDYAHAQGVVHRDIKPENILFHEGEAVLADFGIALAVKEAGGNRLTETGLSLGTPQYMSPEQATGDRAINARSDIYSLAAVVYEMLVGEPPFTGPTAQAMIAKLLTERPTSIRVVRDTVPPGVDAAVSRALAKVPADRFASAGEFVRALDAAMVAPAHASQQSPPRRSPAKRYALAGVAVVAVAALTWFVVRSKAAAGPSVVAVDRVQVTFTGRVRLPSMSSDGKEIAYAVTNCVAAGCTFGIDLQAMGSNETRRLFDGASAMYEIEWSPDRRNLLFTGSVNGVYGVYLLSTIGGAARRVAPVEATFFGSDSLLLVRAPHATPDFWIFVSGLDGIAADSIRIPAFGETFQGFDAVPGSKWIVVRASHGHESAWVAVDRSGHVQDRMTTPPTMSMNASDDAIWMLMRDGPAGQHPILGRVAFNPVKGRFATRIDTLLRLATNAAYSVTADGGTILFDEGISEYDGWAVDFDDGLRGSFSKNASVLHSTSLPKVEVSPDGTRLLVARTDASSNGQVRWSTMPYRGGQESPLPITGTDTDAFWADSTTIEVAERQSGVWRFALLDVRTNARRASLVTGDSVTIDYTFLTPKSWAWLPLDGRSVAIQETGTASPRRLSLPAWYTNLMAISGSPDGGKIAVTGWSAPSGDSLGVSTLSVADGSEVHLATEFGESGGAVWLDDRTLLFVRAAAGETYALERIRGPGAIERLGSIPRPLSAVNVSRDLKHMAAVSRDQHGDAWTMHVVKR